VQRYIRTTGDRVANIKVRGLGHLPHNNCLSNEINYLVEKEESAPNL